MLKTYYTYILKCSDGTLYTGVTTDIERRLSEHNTSNLGAKYTRPRRPVSLVFSHEYPSRSEAQKAESSIKKLTKDQKKSLVENKLEVSQI